jgi:hypothetical protein
LSAAISGFLTYSVFYLIPDLLAGSLSGLGLPLGLDAETVLRDALPLGDVGWGFVLLAIVSPLLKNTRVAGLVGLLTNSYLAYLAYSYLHPGFYSTSLEVPVVSGKTSWTY